MTTEQEKPKSEGDKGKYQIPEGQEPVLGDDSFRRLQTDIRRKNRNTVEGGSNNVRPGTKIEGDHEGEFLNCPISDKVMVTITSSADGYLQTGKPIVCNELGGGIYVSDYYGDEKGTREYSAPSFQLYFSRSSRTWVIERPSRI